MGSGGGRIGILITVSRERIMRIGFVSRRTKLESTHKIESMQASEKKIEQNTVKICAQEPRSFDLLL